MKNVWVKLVFAMVVTTVFISIIPDQVVNAAGKEVVYISVEAFSENVAKEIDVAAVSESYAEGLKAVSIIKEGDFTSYSKNITRGDAMVILSRADEYLNGNIVEAELTQLVIDKRISDIGKVADSKKADVAKAYLKGFMIGYDNGAYSSDRELKVTKRITKEGALSCIAMLKNKSKRAKTSPDGQHIRTTNLPKNAKTYPYILASYPNAYYEKARVFDGVTAYDMNGNIIQYKSGVHYFYPVDINKFKPSWYSDDFTTYLEVSKSKLLDKAVSYVNHVFNVDYRTIDDKWVQEMVELSTYYNDNRSAWYQGRLERYVEFMKNAQTVVKGIGISTDASSLYAYEDTLYLRIRVKYQIVSTSVPSEMDTDTFVTEDPYKALLFSTSSVDLRGFKMSRWAEGYYDVRVEPSLYDKKELALSGMDINIFK